MRAVDGLDRQIAQRIDVGRRIVELDRVLDAADLLRADRIDQVLRGKRVRDVLRREAPRVQRRRIEIDLDLSRLAAIRDMGQPRPAR